MINYSAFAFTVFMLAFAMPAFADDMRLGWPVSCKIWQDCWIVNYTDQDPTENAFDYRCGHHTDNGHDGTDIGLVDRKAMERGVNVVAAAEGVVLGVRNSMPDHFGEPELRQAARDSKSSAGNVVILRHNDGWTTSYSHLLLNSILVKVGERVAKGQILGKVGFSGNTEFPHLHFSVKHHKKIIDPFVGEESLECAASGQKPLWEDIISYEPFSIYAIGFTDNSPAYEKIVQDTTSVKSYPENALTMGFWVLIFGAERGDVINLTVFDPLGKKFLTHNQIREKPSLRLMPYVSKIGGISTPLIPGKYTGQVLIIRNSTPPVTKVVETFVIVEGAPVDPAP